MAAVAITMWRLMVALRKESVDRNPVCWPSPAAAGRVALRKESVDRNHVT